MYNNEDISKLFLVFKLAKFMLGKYTVLNLQIFELLIVFYSIFYVSAGIVGKQDILFDPK